ncbi:MAG: hypothetical protein IKH05_00280 [Bacteroidaceae bacterium]|nr:hypothetical protein [Bacteroidaceae bacterium]
MKRFLFTIIIIVSCLAVSAQGKRTKAKAQAVPEINPVEAISEYRFTEAEDYLMSAIQQLQKKKQPAIREEELLETARKGRIKLQATEQVMIIDSLVLPKTEVLNAIKISSECGSIHPLSNIIKEDSSLCSYFQNQLGDKRMYAQPDKNGRLRLVESQLIANEWSAPTPLKGFEEEENDNFNFPFMLTDGVTMYFAAENAESIGGYDIYMTRYDADEQKFLVPDNIGMPFNSPANDYLYVIDEFNNLGYFVSDRNQPADSVCLYTFIPNDKRSIYNIEALGEEKLRSLAKINSIRDSWTNPALVKEAQKRLNETRNAREEQHKKRDFEFVLNDQHTYYTLSDFKKPRAKEKVQWWLENKKDLRSRSQELERLRARYMSGTDTQKAQMAPQIRLNEEKLEQIEAEIHSLEKEIRELELE